jgi:FtsH-binding integral membrane protein
MQFKRGLHNQRYGISFNRTNEHEAFDAGLRQFLITVYNYLGSGLTLNSLVAYAAAESGLYTSLVKMPLLFWVVVMLLWPVAPPAGGVT